jgi:exonuclease SbcC
VLELALRNYRVFEEVDLELPARVIGIFGENGAGKSTLMEAIAFALYGVDAARTKKQQIRTHGVLTDCEVRLVFEHGGQPYEVRRTIRGRGHAPDAVLFGGGLQLAAGTTEVEAEVRRLLHMDLHVFRASVFAEQKQVDAFSSMRPAERKEMALRLLGIKPVDDARTLARSEARRTTEASEQLAGAIGDLAALEAELKDAKEAATEARRRAKAAAAELHKATKAEAAARKAFTASDAARQSVQTVTAELRAKTDERDRIAERARDLTGRVGTLEAALADLPELEAELAELEGAAEALRAAERWAEAAGRLAADRARLAELPKADPADALAALEAARTEAETAQRAAAEAEGRRAHEAELLRAAEERLERAAEADPGLPCPTCGRPLGEDFAGYLKHCRAEVTEVRRRVREAEREAKAAAAARAQAERRLRTVEREAASVQEALATRTALERAIGALADEVAALAKPFGGEAPDLDALRARERRARELGTKVAALAAERSHLLKARQDLEAATGQLEAVEAAIERLTQEAEGLAFDADEHERLRVGLEEATDALGAARDAEREAADAAKDAEARAAEASGRLQQAKETAERVGDLRSEARYAGRVALLLDGFRDHLVARVGPELSREAEALFRELTNHEYDDLRVDEETLTIQIADGDEYFPIDRFSGSETDLANLSLRVAISTQLSRMSGADVGMLVLDEVLASLDEERKDLMVQALGRLASRFHQLFVITHAERVKDQFPATLLVRKVGRRRSVVELV